MQLHVWRFGLATGVTVAVVYTACAVAVALFPGETLEFFGTWFHGLDFAQLKPAGAPPVTLPRYFTGLAGIVAVAFPAGALLAWVYNATRRGEPS